LFVATSTGVRIINLPGGPGSAHPGASHGLAPFSDWSTKAGGAAASMLDAANPLRLDRGKLPVRGLSEETTGCWSTAAAKYPIVPWPVAREFRPDTDTDLGAGLFSLGLQRTNNER